MTPEERESRKTVRTFALASFLNDFGSDIIYPIWPLFVTSVFGANMAVLGFIDGLGDAVVSLSQAGSGYLSDRLRKRKIFIWLGYLFGSLSRIGYAFSTAWQHLIPFRIFDRMGKIRSAPRDAIIADVSTDENRGRNFGILRSMDNFGAVCGILFCIAFFDLGYKTLFLLAAIPSALGVLLILVFIRETPSLGSRIYKGLSIRQLDANFRLFIFLSSCFALGSFSYSFLLLYVTAPGISPSYVPLFYLVFTLVAALFSLPLGRLSDRIGRKAVLLGSMLLWIATCLAFLHLHSIWGFLSCFILYGLHKAAFEPVQKTLVAELAPPEYRASTMGGFQMVIGLCAFPSSFLAGILWEAIDPSAPLYASIALTCVSTGLLLFVHHREPPLPTS